MVEITFVGTGEDFDSHRANASYLIKNNGQSLLVDCGYTVPKSLTDYLKLRGGSLMDTPDAILLTHGHGGHWGGLPAILVPIWEELAGVADYQTEEQERGIKIFTDDRNLRSRVIARLEEDYPRVFDNFSKVGLYITMQSLRNINQLAGLQISSALTTHSIPNYAYRFDNPKTGKSFAISGDGAFSDASRELYKGVNLLVHEGFEVSGEAFGGNHASIEQVVDYAIENRIPHVAITHIHRTERGKARCIDRVVQLAISEGTNVFFPEDHHSFRV